MWCIVKKGRHDIQIERIPKPLISRVFLVFLPGILCGCGSGSQNDGVTVTGVVLMGGDTAIANPNGADGLTAAPAGTKVSIDYTDGVNGGQVNSPTVDAQGRFTFTMQHTKSLGYSVYVTNACATVAELELGPEYQVLTSYDQLITVKQTPSHAMQQKAAAAGRALGVDVALVIGTDSDSCAQ